jgi:hypothetical protein
MSENEDGGKNPRRRLRRKRESGFSALKTKADQPLS